LYGPLVVWLGLAWVVPAAAQLSPGAHSQVRFPASPAEDARISGAAIGQAEQAYERLLGELSGKTTKQVIEALRAFEAQWPLHAGARLDLALVYCELGNALQAEALFQALETEFDLPSGISQVITLQRERGCAGPTDSASPEAGRFWAEAFAGYSSNANLATRQERVVFGPQAPIPSLDLAPQSRQRSDRFLGTNAGLSGSFSLDAAGFNVPAAYLQLGLSHKAYQRSPWLDTSGLSLVAWQPFGDGGKGAGAGMANSGLGLGFSQWWVDGRAQETAFRVRAEYWGSLNGIYSGLRAGVSAAVLDQRFADNAAFDSRRAELGIRLRQSLNGQSFASLALDRFEDRAEGLRPGGHRQGWAGQTAIFWPYAHGRLQLAWLAQKTSDQDPYNVLFFQDSVRRNVRQQWLVRHDWPRPGGVHFFGQIVVDRAKDVLDIFSFRAVSVQVGWAGAW
jgi:hypothetical protein